MDNSFNILIALGTALEYLSSEYNDLKRTFTRTGDEMAEGVADEYREAFMHVAEGFALLTGTDADSVAVEYDVY